MWLSATSGSSGAAKSYVACLASLGLRGSSHLPEGDMAVICAACGKRIQEAIFFCRNCHVHFGWPCTDSGKCPRCGAKVIKMS